MVSVKIVNIVDLGFSEILQYQSGYLCRCEERPRYYVVSAESNDMYTAGVCVHVGDYTKAKPG